MTTLSIKDLKSQVDIFDIAEKLGIKIGKGDKALCPFHDDKTPSLQFSRTKQICTCFSSNCDAGTMDVVDLVKKKLNLSTREVMEWLSALSPKWAGLLGSNNIDCFFNIPTKYNLAI